LILGSGSLTVLPWDTMSDDTVQLDLETERYLTANVSTL